MKTRVVIGFLLSIALLFAGCSAPSASAPTEKDVDSILSRFTYSSDDIETPYCVCAGNQELYDLLTAQRDTEGGATWAQMLGEALSEEYYNGGLEAAYSKEGPQPFNINTLFVYTYAQEEDVIRFFVHELGGGYHFEEDVLVNDTGYNIPLAVSFPLAPGAGFSSVGVTYPEDGDLYWDSIQAFCTTPISGEPIEGLAEEMADACAEDWIFELDEANLIHYLNACDLSGISLFTYDDDLNETTRPLT